MSNLTVINDPSNSINTIEMSGNTLVNKGITYNDIYRNIISTDDNMYSYVQSKTKLDFNSGLYVPVGEELRIGMNSNVNFNKITLSSTDFSLDKSVATVKYVNDNLNKLDAKDSVLVATTENLSLSGLLTVDSISINTNSRVLVKDQTDNKENGIYIVADGDWTRSADFANASKQQGSYVYVESGSTHKNKGFMLTGPEKTVGTSELEFAQFNGAPAFEAGDGLTSIGNTLNLDNSLTNVTTMSGLTAVGSADVNTIFSGPVVANEGLEGDLTGNVTGDLTGNVDGIVGGTTPAAITGTTITANTGFSGNVTGNVTGDLSGNAATASAAKQDSDLANKIRQLSDNGETYSGNVTGNVDGIVGGTTPAAITGTTITANTGFSGNVIGDLSGNVTGNVLGSVIGNVTGDVDGIVGGTTPAAITGTTITANTGFSGNVTGDLTGNVDGIVGGTTPAAITGTTITANTGFSGNVTGNVTGTIILPTEDPNISGALWNNGGTITISSG